jgi:hypothetical protein
MGGHARTDAKGNARRTPQRRLHVEVEVAGAKHVASFDQKL